MEGTRKGAVSHRLLQSSLHGTINSEGVRLLNYKQIRVKLKGENLKKFFHPSFQRSSLLIIFITSHCTSRHISLSCSVTNIICSVSPLWLQKGHHC